MLDAVVPDWGAAGDTAQCLETFLIVTARGRGLLLVLTGQKPGMCLCTPQCTEQLMTQNYLVRSVTVPRWGNPGFT